MSRPVELLLLPLVFVEQLIRERSIRRAWLEVARFARECAAKTQARAAARGRPRLEPKSEQPCDLPVTLLPRLPFRREVLTTLRQELTSCLSRRDCALLPGEKNVLNLSLLSGVAALLFAVPAGAIVVNLDVPQAPGTILPNGYSASISDFNGDALQEQTITIDAVLPAGKNFRLDYTGINDYEVDFFFFTNNTTAGVLLTAPTGFLSDVNGNAVGPAPSVFYSTDVDTIFYTLSFDFETSTAASFEHHDVHFSVVLPKVSGGLITALGLAFRPEPDIFVDPTDPAIPPLVFGEITMSVVGADTGDTGDADDTGGTETGSETTGTEADGAAIPEPATAGLGLLAISGVALAASRRRA